MSAKRIGPEELTARFQDALAEAIEMADGTPESIAFLRGFDTAYQVFAKYRDEPKEVDLTDRRTR